MELVEEGCVLFGRAQPSQHFVLGVAHCVVDRAVLRAVRVNDQRGAMLGAHDVDLESPAGCPVPRGALDAARAQSVAGGLHERPDCCERESRQRRGVRGIEVVE